MWQKLKNSNITNIFFNTKNLGLYAIALIALSVAWSSAKIIQKNYELEKQIAIIDQQVEIQEQLNKNQKLKNEYFKTDAFLDLATRNYFGKSQPGEKLILVPKEVAASYVKVENTLPNQNKENSKTPKLIKNWQSWINFYTNRK